MLSESTQVTAAHLKDGDEVPLATIPVAVPHFSVRMTAVCVERRRLSVVTEYILRATTVGFDRPEEIASYLGLLPEQVIREVQELERGGFVSLEAPAGMVRLTDKGSAAILSDGPRARVVKEISCVVNGVTRRPLIVGVDLLPRRRLQVGTLTLPAVPARPPRANDLDLPNVKTALAISSNAQYRSLEVSKLGRVFRTGMLFQPAQLMLRRGVHSAPTISVEGTADLNLARELGAHAALQSLRKRISRQEQSVRHELSAQRPKFRGQGNPSAETLRLALTAAHAWLQAAADNKKSAWSEFTVHVKRLIAKSHWLGAAELDLLQLYAVCSASRHLLLVVPDVEGIISRDLLLAVGTATVRGVTAEVHMDADAITAVAADPELRAQLKKVKIGPRPRSSGWCGVCVDSGLAVVGQAKVLSSPMGRYSTFFGVAISDSADGAELLREFVSNSVPITRRGPRRIDPRR